MLVQQNSCLASPPSQELHSGQTGTFALKKIKRKDIRKGMVMVAPALKPVAVWDFEAEVVILHHPSTITLKYQVQRPEHVHPLPCLTTP